jgi:hypothetical protein
MQCLYNTLHTSFNDPLPLHPHRTQKTQETNGHALSVLELAGPAVKRLQTQRLRPQGHRDREHSYMMHEFAITVQKSIPCHTTTVRQHYA